MLYFNLYYFEFFFFKKWEKIFIYLTNYVKKYAVNESTRTFLYKKKIITFLTQLLQKEAQNEVPSCRWWHFILNRVNDNWETLGKQIFFIFTPYHWKNEVKILSFKCKIFVQQIFRNLYKRKKCFLRLGWKVKQLIDY